MALCHPVSLMAEQKGLMKYLGTAAGGGSSLASVRSIFFKRFSRKRRSEVVHQIGGYDPQRIYRRQAWNALTPGYY